MKMKKKIKIKILNKIDNENFEYDTDLIKNNDLIEYKLEESLYSIKISSDDSIAFKSSGAISYDFKLKEKKVFPSFLKNEEYVFKVYVYTEKLKIDNDEINLSYNLYTDENLNDMISSYEIVFKIC